MEICLGIVSVGLNRPSTPRDRLVVTAEVELRYPGIGHPGVSQRVSRTEAQGLGNVSLRLFGATQKKLANSDKGVGGGEISIQRQRMFTFGNALRSAVRYYLEKPQDPMTARMVWERRQGFGQLRFGPREGGHGIGYKGICAVNNVRRRRPNECIDIAR